MLIYSPVYFSNFRALLDSQYLIGIHTIWWTFKLFNWGSDRSGRTYTIVDANQIAGMLIKHCGCQSNTVDHANQTLWGYQLNSSDTNQILEIPIEHWKCQSNTGDANRMGILLWIPIEHQGCQLNGNITMDANRIPSGIPIDHYRCHSYTAYTNY